LLAVGYLHSKNICHRDLKAENILLECSSPFSKVILTDFGLSKVLQNNVDQMQTKCGTFTYLAPEIIDSASYSTQVDSWALGVLLYTMIACELPFGPDTSASLLSNIRTCNYSFDSKWHNTSESLRDLISRLIVVDPKLRYTVKDALNHPWIKKHEQVLESMYGKV
jgi:serine/threonine protein kinase